MPKITAACRLALASVAALGGFARLAHAQQAMTYTDYARNTIDTLIAKGTDRYGGVQSPHLLMSILDANTLNSPQNPGAYDEAWRVIRRGRRNPGGGNLATDQPLLDSMDRLSKATGNSTYTNFANNYTSTYTQNFYDPSKGFVRWGWHQWINYYGTTNSYTSADGDYHELHSTYPVNWSRMWAQNPTRALAEANATWNWHVVDKNPTSAKYGMFNRHGDGNYGWAISFAFSGGEIANQFANASLHATTAADKQMWMDRAKVVENFHWSRRDPVTGLIPDDAAHMIPGDRFDSKRFMTSISGPYCRMLLTTYDQTGETVFRDHSVSYLKAYNQYGYDSSTGKFYGSLQLNGTPVTTPRGPDLPNDDDYSFYEPTGHVDLWQPYLLGYEHPMDTAYTSVLAYDLTGDAAMLQMAKRFATWIKSEMATHRSREGTWYDGYSKNWSDDGTYAETYGRMISFFSYLYAVTGDAQYLDLARAGADDAIAKLYVTTNLNGTEYGLLKGHPDKPYYEAVDGVGFLTSALIDLDTVAQDRGALLAERSVIPIPEPACLALFAVAGVMTMRRPRRKQDE